MTSSRRGAGCLAATLLALTACTARAQSSTEVKPPAGKVIFSSEHPPAVPEPTESSSQSTADLSHPDALPKIAVTNAERSAIAITAYDLDVHLTPASFREEVRATLTVRNTSNGPLTRIPLQLSSTLHWQTIGLRTAQRITAVPFTQSPIATDTDHTGYAEEAILELPTPLGAGDSLTLSAFYSGEIRQSAARIELLGTPHAKAVQTDWDGIEAGSDAVSTALRGFGDVLWYPVAAPTATLGEGNELFEAVAHQRRLGETATIALRLTVEFAGEAPTAVVFDGARQSLTRTADLNDQLVAEAHGIATAEFPKAVLGFRTPCLFLTTVDPTPAAGPLLSVVTANSDAITPYATAATSLEPVLTSWFGEGPDQPLTILDHAGDAFEDHSLIVAHLSATAPPEGIAPEIVGALTHAWFRASAPSSVWLDQGLPEFMGLMEDEQEHGRASAVSQLEHAATLIALAEPDLSAPKPALQPLTEAYADVFLRLKSASVLWQLRELLGEDVLKRGIRAFHQSLEQNPAFDRDQTAFEKTLERVSNKELGWFFEDWVYRDRGLADLTVVQVNPRSVPARVGKSGGFLVAVEVRNDGDAVADVPVTVRSGTLTTTERLRIAGHASASTRILFEGTPEVLQVNDGSVAELRSSIHTQRIDPPTPSVTQP